MQRVAIAVLMMAVMTACGDQFRSTSTNNS